ncbi:MAG: ribonuclease III [Hyphomicrobiales bacterium]
MVASDAAKPDLDTLQEALDYRFQNADLLIRAITHRSSLPGGGDDPSLSYQRLEFMGDRVLALVIADLLYQAFPNAEEGELARRLTGLVRKETCADVARDWNASNHVLISEAERRGGGHERDAILGDVCEAVLAAVYYDGGIEAARKLIVDNWHDRMMSWSKPLRDPKTALQEWAHGRKLATPDYIEISRSGPDHALTFVIEVDVKGKKNARGKGASKREAQQKAAANFLLREGIWEDDIQ